MPKQLRVESTTGSDELAAVRAALADAQRPAPEVTFLDRIRALEQAVDLLLRELEARRP